MKKAGNLTKTSGKLLGNVSKVFGLLDTVDIVSKVTDSTIPLIDKALDRHHEHRRSLVRLDNLVHMDLFEAKAHLEQQGFIVSTILAKPSKKYQQAKINEVVEMSPKSGKLPIGSLVKLYYLDHSLMNQIKEMISLPDLVGLPISQAQDILDELGLKPVPLLLPASKEYAKYQPNQVINMSPKPNLVKNQIKKGSLVKLNYLNEENLLASQALAQAWAEKQANRQEKVLKTLKQTGKIFK
ncbi:PASTA domain-containing protein [Streptococcus sp. sy010]|uniref:PASTA domain-containing protein n=1 Tax=Streptococcus sp. sy010 TaxID=2600148 RepID=UPI0011B53B10|nr:PASTA domain-containing protein [Streptococcus sp. sy010]TWT16693.1 PASTA domain-containing protein [Streptococcus sp. sy010]